MADTIKLVRHEDHYDLLLPNGERLEKAATFTEEDPSSFLQVAVERLGLVPREMSVVTGGRPRSMKKRVLALTGQYLVMDYFDHDDKPILQVFVNPDYEEIIDESLNPYVTDMKEIVYTDYMAMA
ncbi:MAG: hypothetical protein DSZ10_00205 [Sulfurovum sp.]|nr:MAG: hypothetical protein DSZ10_00205 [Sulfurovum sp.]